MTSTPAKISVESGREMRLVGTEGEGLARRKQRLLGVDLLRNAGPARPLVKDERGQRDSLTLGDRIAKHHPVARTAPLILPSVTTPLCVVIYMVTIYIHFMSTMKTTVYLDSADYRRLKARAAAEGRSAAELIRAAVSEYARKRAPRALPRSLGAGRSGDPSLSERSEDLLQGMGEDS